MRIVLLMVLFIPGVVAWNWDTHEAIITSVYYHLNDTWKEKLSLEHLQEGSVIPDKIFKDFSKHGFPEAIDETRHWLDQTKVFLARKDYANASISLGIASHYMGDSFAAPHSVAGEPYSLHKGYEDQASQDYFYASCLEQDLLLKDIIYTGSQQGSTWQDWLERHDPALPQASTREATLYVTAFALSFFDDTCHTFETHIEEAPFTFNVTTAIVLTIILLGIGWTSISLYRDLKDYGK